MAHLPLAALRPGGCGWIVPRRPIDRNGMAIAASSSCSMSGGIFAGRGGLSLRGRFGIARCGGHDL